MARSKWIEALDRNTLLMYKPDEIAGISTNILDFKTRNNNIINACFGLANYGSVYNNFNFSQYPRFYDFAPFVGINVNFRAMDKNIPLRSVPNKTIFHRLSLFTGITLTTVNDGSGTRMDLFPKNQFSLLCGFSFRFTNTIRLCFGSLVFKRPDPNPLLNRTLITTCPFIGLNFDFDLKNTFGDFANLFK